MTESALLNFREPLDIDAESLEIEFKRSLPLDEKAGKAKLAKEICALANHGGGWIVLGRNDDGSYPATLPEILFGIDQDTINQIASAYLQPTPHCSVRWVKPNNVAYEVLVIWVSPLRVSPVSAAKNGPNGERGGTVGVTKGTHYIRKAGPISAPIESPDEWQTVIRRCVLSDKTSLLAALTTMLERPNSSSEEDEKTPLDGDLEHVIAAWKDEASKTSYEVDLSQNFIAYGFQLVSAEPVTIPQIKECLRRRPADPRGEHQFFNSGYNSPYSPIIIEVAGVAGLEVRTTSNDFDLRSIWRLGEALSGVEVISYWEDTEWMKSAVEGRSSRKWHRGKAIWLQQQVAYCNNFLEMVQQISDFFNYDGAVRLYVLFSGLKGRSLNSPNPGVYYSMDYTAHQNTKQVDINVNASALQPEARSATIAAIVQAMNKLTQGPELTAETVVKMLASRK